MIALIALFALAVVVGVVIGILAIVIALIKTILSRIRRRQVTELHGAAGDPVSDSVTPQRATDQECMRLITTK